MLRALCAIGMVAACGAPAGRPAAPLANAEPDAAGPCDLAWIAKAEELIVTEHSNGHFGVFALRAELHASAEVLAGVVRATYQEHPEATPRLMTVELDLPRRDLADVLGAIARGSRSIAARSIRSRGWCGDAIGSCHARPSSGSARSTSGSRSSSGATGS